ncbi:MAG: helicase-related protein [Thermoguttaceae bacterium]
MYTGVHCKCHRIPPRGNRRGIDLHRHCRHVVHFDLAWNPAVLEQRTGRADRIGSKTFRE